jgi:hypothetical protein
MQNPTSSGVESDAPAAPVAPAERGDFPVAPTRTRLIQGTLRDQTDNNSELLQENEWRLRADFPRAQLPFDVAAGCSNGASTCGARARTWRRGNSAHGKRRAPRRSAKSTGVCVARWGE